MCEWRWDIAWLITRVGIGWTKCLPLCDEINGTVRCHLNDQWAKTDLVLWINGPYNDNLLFIHEHNMFTLLYKRTQVLPRKAHNNIKYTLHHDVIYHRVHKYMLTLRPIWLNIIINIFVHSSFWIRICLLCGSGSIWCSCTRWRVCVGCHTFAFIHTQEHGCGTTGPNEGR